MYLFDLIELKFTPILQEVLLEACFNSSCLSCLTSFHDNFISYVMDFSFCFSKSS